MEHTKHIIRAVLLLVLAAVAFVLVRHFAIPATFGEHGYYRYESVSEYASIPVRHGGIGACTDCHEEQAETNARGKHRSVSCEVCHSPLGDHVQDDARTAAMPVKRSATWCLTCHLRLSARPKAFPKIDVPAHVTDKGAEMSKDICLECHDAHNPTDETEAGAAAPSDGAGPQ